MPGVANGEMMRIRLVSATPKPLVAIATAAAITRGQTYNEFCSDLACHRFALEDYVRRLYKAGHWSVFEFADFDFEVEGASRVFETQVVRSRIGSYEWESGRRAQTYKPSAAATTLVLGKHIDYMVGAYESVVADEGMQPENARYILPQGVARKGRIKKNFRAWMETAQQRLCTKTQWEYREFMQTVKSAITQEDVFLGSLMVPKCEWLGYCPEANGCGRKRPKKEVIALRVWYVAINAEGEVVESSTWLDGMEQHVSAIGVLESKGDAPFMIKAWSSDGPDEALEMARVRLREIAK
jgi:thymidylate synthase (FAD)